MEKTFGEKVRERRRVLNLTQEELAERVGLTKTAISAYERGTSKPRFRNMQDLAKVLGCDLSYLICRGAVEMQEQNDDVSAAETELLRCFRVMPDRAKKALLISAMAWAEWTE